MGKKESKISIPNENKNSSISSIDESKITKTTENKKFSNETNITNKTKLIKETIVTSGDISCIGLIKYSNKDFLCSCSS